MNRSSGKHAISANFYTIYQIIYPHNSWVLLLGHPSDVYEVNRRQKCMSFCYQGSNSKLGGRCREVEGAGGGGGGGNPCQTLD